MRRITTVLIITLSCALMLAIVPNTSSAHKQDLAITRFITCIDNGNICYPRLADYESFLAEYALGIAPKNLAPAETLGYSGFYLGLEGTITPVPSGSKKNWEDGTIPDGIAPRAMFNPSVRIRKGLPWSFEIGSSINYLAQSELVGLGGEIKWSLFEGYRHGFRGVLPDVAARGSVVRVLGESDVDMTIIGVDGSVSYPFGLGGMISLTPFMGFQYLWTIVRTEPGIYRDSDLEFHPTEGDDYNISGLLSGPNLGRAKLFWGARIKYEMLSIVVEVDWAIQKKWNTNPGDYFPNSMQDEEDDLYEEQNQASVGNQVQIAFGVGLDF